MERYARRWNFALFVVLSASAAGISGCGATAEPDDDAADSEAAGAKEDQTIARPVGTFEGTNGAGQLRKLVLRIDRTFHAETIINCLTPPCVPQSTNGRYSYARSSSGTRIVKLGSLGRYAYEYNAAVAPDRLRLRRINTATWFSLALASQPGCAEKGACGPVIISKTPGFQFEAESHVVAMPDGGLFAVWMTVGSPRGQENGYAISKNNGVTWTPAATMGGTSTRGDPFATVGPDGSLYYGFLDGTCASGVCFDGRVWVARKPAAASAFGAPVDVSPANPNEFYDKPWMMTGSDGSLVVTFSAREGTPPNNFDRIVVARSTDGAVWSRSDAVPKRPAGQIASIPHACVSKQGTRMWIVFVDSESPLFASIRWSDDLGRTWPTVNQSAGFALARDAAHIQAYDLRCVGEGDNVWVLYGLASLPSSSPTGIPALEQIRLAHSKDGGKTWIQRTVRSRPGEIYLRPEIVLEPSGAIDVAAYVGAVDGDTNGEVRWWRSSDDGRTFIDRGALVKGVRITGDLASNAWLGDYSGFAFARGEILGTFVDNSTGSSHVAFVRRPVE